MEPIKITCKAFKTIKILGWPKNLPANAGDMGLIPGSGRPPGEGNGDFPSGSDDKESACNAGDVGSIPGSGRSLGKENGNPLQYSCLGNPMEEEPGGV